MEHLSHWLYLVAHGYPGAASLFLPPQTWCGCAGVQLQVPKVMALLCPTAACSKCLGLCGTEFIPGEWSWMNISSQEQCRWVPLLSPSGGQPRPWDRDRHVAISSLRPHVLLGMCLQKRYLIFQGGTCSFQGWLALPVLSQKDCHSSENHSLPGLGMEQPAMISWPGWGAWDGAGGVAQSKKWCLFLQKGADGGRRVPFFPVLPPLSPRTPPGCCGAAGGGFRARSHVLPAQPSRACRGRSRHAPAALGRRKQIGFPAGVQGAGRPWLVSHHRSVGTGCGERPSRAGMEGADLAEGSPQAAGSLQEAGHDLGLTRSQGCCLCLCLPLVLRWACSLGGGRC